MVDCVQRPFQQIFPQPGWVEHNPQEILFSQLGCLTELLARHGFGAEDIDSIGIDNQRETTVVWDPTTGAPVCNAIVWQCRRTAELVERVCGAPEVRQMVRAKTGLLPDAYFSASKIAWILKNVPGARERAEAGELLFGTVDTCLSGCSRAASSTRRTPPTPAAPCSTTSIAAAGTRSSLTCLASPRP